MRQRNRAVVMIVTLALASSAVCQPAKEAIAVGKQCSEPDKDVGAYFTKKTGCPLQSTTTIRCGSKRIGERGNWPSRTFMNQAPRAGSYHNSLTHRSIGTSFFGTAVS